MTSKKLSDREGKALLLKWPTRTRLWPPPGNRGYWIRGQPKDLKAPGPRLSSPGASLFTTQPDGLWVHFNDGTYCDIVVIEICGTIQNLNDKRSRYIPASHSLVLSCSARWLKEEISIQRAGKRPRWKASGTFKSEPSEDLSIPVRNLRVLYAIPNELYDGWCRDHAPTGYEYFTTHSSLSTYNSQSMQTFLRQMSTASQFRKTVRPK